MSWNWITTFGVSLALFCCGAAKLLGGTEMTGPPRGYWGISESEDSQSRFEQMMEQRDINLATRALMCEGFTRDEIQDAVQNRHVRMGSWPGYYACNTYLLIVGRAHILRQLRMSPL
jgi:hypothetical protein